MIDELGPPIAYGRTAEIHAWKEGQILKLFYDWFSLENIETERRNTGAVHAHGLPVPAVGEIVTVKGRHGLEYERIRGETMFRMFRRKPWNVFRYGWRMAQLQVNLHQSILPAGLASQHQVLRDAIQHAEALTSRLRAKALAALDSLPDGDRLCHGDFWPSNILFAPEGERIIDWFRATCGNPLADLARTTNLATGFFGTSQVQRPFLTFGSTRLSQVKNTVFQLFCHLCYPAYIHFYFRLSPGGEQEYRRWLPVVAAARLADAIPELEKMLIRQVEK
jgi:uncharacterized protein (TIGR02172 family)